MYDILKHEKEQFKQTTTAEKNCYLVEELLVYLQGSLGIITTNMGKHYLLHSTTNGMMWCDSTDSIHLLYQIPTEI